MDAVGSPPRSAPCAGCGYRNLHDAVACSLCSAVLATVPSSARREALASQHQITQAAGAAPFLQRESSVFSVATQDRAPSAWTLLGVGLFIAPVFLLPLFRYMGWFLASLVHETGHCVFAWLFGHPAYPAIRLDGHAAAVHREQHMFLVVLVGLGLAGLLYWVRHRPRLRIAAACALVLYPLIALSDAREVLHLLGGHLSELAFAGIFFYRAMSGGFTSSIAERFTYAACAWFLLGRNLVLSFGLITSAAGRAQYASSGSFGLTNDYLRVANHHLHWSLESVAGLMLLFSLAVLPIVLWVRSRVERLPAL